VLAFVPFPFTSN